MMLHQHFLGPSTSLTGTSNTTQTILTDGGLISQAVQPREELKSSFETREGVYKIMTLAEYSRPRGLQQYQMQSGMPNSNVQAPFQNSTNVRASFLTLNKSKDNSVESNEPSSSKNVDNVDANEVDDYYSDKLCFNIGRELYVYHYRGTQTAADLARPIDKRVYKGTAPTVHCFNQESATPKNCSLVIGFSTGQLQVIDPLEKTQASLSRLYNEDRVFDKSAVTCIRWLPGNPSVFLASYASGNLFVYNEDVANVVAPPVWNILKQGERFSVYSCKSKQPRNPVYRWQIGEGAIHQFSFSGPDAKMLATVGHDGFLRIFNYQQMELVAVMKSYFGGLLTLAWSPDAKLIATGGEDDLITVYSVIERRVVCRGQGHKSWISQVQFDSYCCTLEDENEINGNNDDTIQSKSDQTREKIGASLFNSSEINTTPVMRSHTKRNTPLSATSTLSRCSFASFGTINGLSAGTGCCYRVGSVGHDTLLCLWDITEDMLKPANIQRHRNSTIIAPMACLEIQTSSLTGKLDILAEASPGGASAIISNPLSDPPATQKNEKPKKKKFHKRGFTIGRLNVGGGSSSSSNGTKHGFGTSNCIVPNGTEPRNNFLSCCDENKLLGSRVCPKLQDVPIIEPLMCKKIAHERLTVLEFRKECIVTACQEGYICTWARPGKDSNSINTAPIKNQATTFNADCATTMNGINEKTAVIVGINSIRNNGDLNGANIQSFQSSFIDDEPTDQKQPRNI